MRSMVEAHNRNMETERQQRLREQDEALRIVAERDGLTLDNARALIERWSWPVGMAIQPAYEKATANHPHWQAWRDAMRDEITWEGWQAFLDEKKAESRRGPFL